MRGVEVDPGSEAHNSTVDRALRVLEAFLVDRSELGVVELSRELELDKSVIHRILATLVRRRFLEQDPVSRRYRVGLRAWELGRRYLDEHHLEALAEQALTPVVGEHAYCTGYLATLDAGDVVVVATFRGRGPINVYIDPGTRMAAELTATGRSLLACLPVTVASSMVTRRRERGLDGRQAAGVRAVQRELQAISDSGVSISRGEYVPGIGTVAVAMRSPGGEPIGALSVDFLIGPETENLWDVLPAQLADGAREIERALGA